MAGQSPNLLIPVLTGEKLSKICWKNIPIQYLQKNGISIGKKPVEGVCESWNSAHKYIILCLEKHLKIIFFTGALIIVKMEFEIYKYLHQYFYCLIIFYKGNLKQN